MAAVAAAKDGEGEEATLQDAVQAGGEGDGEGVAVAVGDLADDLLPGDGEVVGAAVVAFAEVAPAVAGGVESQ